MALEEVVIDFDKMIVKISDNGKMFNISRVGNDWFFINSTHMQTTRRNLSKETSVVIEKAYVQWSLEKTILGV